MWQALTAASLWGATDVFSGVSARRSTPLLAALWLHLASLVVLAPFVAALPAVSPSVVALGSLAGIAAAIGDVLFGRALSKSPMSIGIPLANVVAAAIPVLIIVIQGEHLTLLGAFGVVGAILASALAAAPSNGRLAIQGAGYAVAAGLFFGAMYSLLAQVAAVNTLAVIFIMRLAGTVVLLPWLLQAGQRSVPLIRSGAVAGIASGLASVGANALYIVAIANSGSRVVASVLAIALSAPAAMVIAHWTTYERLSRLQSASAASAVGAIVMLAIQGAISSAGING